MQFCVIFLIYWWEYSVIIMDKSTKHKRKKSSYDKRYDSSDSEEAKHKANRSSGKHKHSNESDDYEKSKYYLKHKNDSETSSSKHKNKENTSLQFI